MLSTDIKDYKDIGLNADWCVSTYRLSADHFIFDNEDSFKEYSLCLVTYVDENTCNEEHVIDELFSGTFAECVEEYNKNHRGRK